jgi:hypothetical protein
MELRERNNNKSEAPPRMPLNIAGTQFEFSLFKSDEDPNKYCGYGDNILKLDPMGDKMGDSEKELVILPPTRTIKFDTLGNYFLIRNTTKRGQRRNHILQLGARYLRRDVKLVTPMLDETECQRYKKVLTLLQSTVLGTRVQFKDSKTIHYQIDSNLHVTLSAVLQDIGLRTTQITELQDFQSLLPRFGNFNHFPVNGVYTANDWEIIACTFKCEVESYLKIMLELGYDFQGPVLEEAIPEKEEDEKAEDWGNVNEIPGGYISNTPVKVRPEVLALMTGDTLIFASEFFDTLDEQEDDNNEKGKTSKPKVASTSSLKVKHLDTPSKKKKPGKLRACLVVRLHWILLIKIEITGSIESE